MMDLMGGVDAVDAAAVTGGRPLWQKTVLRADRWSAILGASDYLTRAIKFGVRDMTSIPFTAGEILSEVPPIGGRPTFRTG